MENCQAIQSDNQRILLQADLFMGRSQARNPMCARVSITIVLRHRICCRVPYEVRKQLPANVFQVVNPLEWFGQRWRHIEHLRFECPRLSGPRGPLTVKLLRDDLFRACSGSYHATAALLATFPSDHTPVVAATACLVTFLLDPAAALGRPPPWRMKFQFLALVAAF